jgi:hypothetical protein
MNLGNTSLKVPAGTLVGRPRKVVNDHIPKAHANYSNTNKRTKFELEALESAIQEMDINPELSNDRRRT